MRTEIVLLYNAMISYMYGDASRIQHFVKVHSYASLIGTMEHLDTHTLFILRQLPFCTISASGKENVFTEEMTAEFRNSWDLPKPKSS